MINRYQITCKNCNFSIITEVSAIDVQYLRAYCQGCRKLIADVIPQQTTVSKVTQNRIQTPTTSTDPPGPKKFAGYTMIQKIGQGSMGRIYLALDEATKEKVALKILDKEFKGSKISDRFQREQQILLDLEHPNIIKLKSFGSYNGYSYFAMEYVEGSNLLQLVEKQAIPWNHAVQVTFFVAKALEYLHSHQIFHRDIKPSNVLVSRTGVPKLIDFGIAKVYQEAVEKLTKTGNMMGTAYYISPEQFRDAKRADQRSDVYGLGATLYHLLCGFPPFSEFKLMVKIIRVKIIGDSYMRLGERSSNIPDKVLRIVEKCMEQEPDKRYQNMQSLAEDLQKVGWE